MSGSVVIGYTMKKKFFAALFAGLLVLAAMGGIFGITGTAFALPLGGMGDFHVQFEKLEGKGFSLMPQIGETGDSNQAPLVRNKIDSATVYGLLIYKDLKLPTGKWIRINIEGTQPTTIKGLIQDARYISANLQFNELAVEEHNTAKMSAEEAFKKNWGQSADTVTITDGKIVTDYLFQNMVNLQGAKISIQSIDKPGEVSDSDHSSGIAQSGSGGDHGGSELGGRLPDTAGNTFMFIALGSFLIALGTAIILRKRSLKEFKDA